MKPIGTLALVAALVATMGCGAGVSDTGYVGTWQRMGGEPSTISLRREESGTYRFRWSLRSAAKSVACDPEGLCREEREGKTVYQYRFTVVERPGTPGLFLEVEGTPVDSEIVPVRWTDRLVLQPGGLELWSYMLEMNGETFEAPRGPLRFAKTSDLPF